MNEAIINSAVISTEIVCFILLAIAIINTQEVNKMSINKTIRKLVLAAHIGIVIITALVFMLEGMYYLVPLFFYPIWILLFYLTDTPLSLIIFEDEDQQMRGKD